MKNKQESFINENVINRKKHKTSNKESSYKRLSKVCAEQSELLQEIADLELSRWDGISEAAFFRKFKKIVFEKILKKPEDSLTECPLCGRFSSHSHKMEKV